MVPLICHLEMVRHKSQVNSRGLWKKEWGTFAKRVGCVYANVQGWGHHSWLEPQEAVAINRVKSTKQPWCAFNVRKSTGGWEIDSDKQLKQAKTVDSTKITSPFSSQVIDSRSLFTACLVSYMKLADTISVSQWRPDHLYKPPLLIKQLEILMRDCWCYICSLTKTFFTWTCVS